MRPEYPDEREPSREWAYQLVESYNAYNELDPFAKQEDDSRGTRRASFNKNYKPRRADVENAMERARARGSGLKTPDIHLALADSGDLYFIPDQAERTGFAIVPRFGRLYDHRVHEAGGFGDIFETNLVPDPDKTYAIHLEEPARCIRERNGYAITQKGRLQLREVG